MGEYLDACELSLECKEPSPSSATDGIIRAVGIEASSISSGPLQKDLVTTPTNLSNPQKTAHRNITSSCSPGSLLYAGRDTVEICDGVRRGRLFLLARPAAVVPPELVALPPLIVPASCSAVSSLVPDAFAPEATLAPRAKPANRPPLPVLFDQVTMAIPVRIMATTRMGAWRAGEVMWALGGYEGEGDGPRSRGGDLRTSHRRRQRGLGGHASAKRMMTKSGGRRPMEALVHHKRRDRVLVRSGPRRAPPGGLHPVVAVVAGQ